MESHFSSAGIGKSKIIYMNLYPNRWSLVNKIKISAGSDILRIHGKSVKYRYVDGITSLVIIRIS